MAATATLFHAISADDWHRGGRESLRSVGEREEEDERFTGSGDEEPLS